MRRIARENALCALATLLACAMVAYLGLENFAWSDYEHEVAPAFAALVHGHVGEFLRLAPAYGGSLVERAPFALLPSLWGGGALAVYRAAAAPCLLATALLGVWLLARMRAEGRPGPARALALLVCVANPMTLRALEIGHPEEVLGACLCVAAVLLAAGQRSLWAGLALGLAVANKEWALLAAGPVLLALPPGRRLSCSALAAAVAGAVLAPLALVHAGSFVTTTRATASTGGAIFEPAQLWWFFGHHVSGAAAQAPGSRVGPAWIGAISHPSILVLGLLVSLELWRRERRAGATSARSALLALALLLLLRCLLDTWDTSYYTLPFLLALLAWQVRGPLGELPLLAAGSTALASVTFLWLPEHASNNLQAALFLAWSVPLAALLAAQLFTPSAFQRLKRLLGRAPAPAQEMTVSVFPRPLSTS
jgi:Glycosyltransferase family 87